MFKTNSVQKYSDEYVNAVNRIINLSKSNNRTQDSWVKWADVYGYTDELLLKLCEDLDTGATNIQEVEEGFEAASKKGGAFTTTLENMAANMGIMLGIMLAIKAATWVWDQINVTVAEQQSKDKLFTGLH